jgi:hypothetical protein
MNDSPSAVSDSPPKKRTRAWRRWGMVLLLIAFAVGGGFLFYQHWASAELNTIIAKLDHDDPGWRFEDIEAKRKIIPDSANSALQILAVNQLQKGQSLDVPDTEELFANLPPQVRLSEKQVAFLKKQFDPLKQAVLAARKLKDTPEGRFQIKYSDDFMSTFGSEDMSGLIYTREIAELLKWDAALRGQTGDEGGVLESCQAIQNAALAVADEPSLISLLVRYACNAVAVESIERALAQCDFTKKSEPILRAMQVALAKEASAPTLYAALRGERAGVHQYFAAVAEGKASQCNEFVSARIHGATLRLHTDFAEALKLPPEEREPRLRELRQQTQSEPDTVRDLLESLTRMRKADTRNQAKLHCALAGVAA